MTATLELRPLSRLYKALGDETRLRIVALLSHGELCVCHIEAALELPQPTASRQLSVLRNAGVVDSRREGTWIYYRLATGLAEPVRRQLKPLVSELAKQLDLKKDVERLLRSKGPGACK